LDWVLYEHRDGLHHIRTTHFPQNEACAVHQYVHSKEILSGEDGPSLIHAKWNLVTKFYDKKYVTVITAFGTKSVRVNIEVQIKPKLNA
jgi:hypothetical protein